MKKIFKKVKPEMVLGLGIAALITSTVLLCTYVLPLN